MFADPTTKLGNPAKTINMLLEIIESILKATPCIPRGDKQPIQKVRGRTSKLGPFSKHDLPQYNCGCNGNGVICVGNDVNCDILKMDFCWEEIIAYQKFVTSSNLYTHGRKRPDIP